jgi:hypothetical protein
MHGADRGSTTAFSRVARLTVVSALLSTLALTSRARAHVQASLDENNRYVKLTPMGDRVRLAYTIFLGEQPGSALRRRLDHNHDGQVDDAEAAAYGREIAARVYPAVTVTLDDRPAKIAWTTLDVGMGTSSVSAGSFSVDLIGWICTGGDAHHLVLRDTVEIEQPGDTELKLEDGPGVHIGAHTVGGEAFKDGLDTVWRGAGGPLTQGLDVAWTVDGAAPRPEDGRCHGGAGAENTNAPQRWWLWGVALAIVAVLAAIGGRQLLRQRKVNG